MIISMDSMLGARAIFDSLSKEKFHIKLSFKIKKILQAMKPDYEIFTEEFQRLLQEYGEKDEKGNQVISSDGGFKIKLEYLNTCQKELLDLNTQEISLDISKYLLTVEDLEYFDKISVDDLEAIEPFVKDFDNFI